MGKLRNKVSIVFLQESYCSPRTVKKRLKDTDEILISFPRSQWLVICFQLIIHMVIEGNTIDF